MRTLFILSAIALLSACDGGKDDPTPPNSVGPLGVVEDRAPGLTGTDANANGIRDDVDALIAKDFAATPEIQKVTEQSAKAIQTLMLATNKESALAAMDLISRATNCQFSLLHGTPEMNALRSAIGEKISALTLNTKERIAAYASASGIVSGSVFHLHTANTCE